MNCGKHTGAKLLEPAMKIVDKALEKQWEKIVMIDDMQLGFMPGKDTMMQSLFYGG